MNELLTSLSLYSEFIVCLAAASILSLIVGWMLSSSSAKKRLEANNASWEEKLQKLEETAAADTNNLEEQLQALAGDTRNLKATNQVLTDSLKKNDSTIQNARAEAIELNRQNAETQERLQRVIQQKAHETAGGTNRLSPSSTNALGLKGSTYNTASGLGTEPGADYDASLTDEFEATSPEDIEANPAVPSSTSDETAINNADTIAFNPTDVFDATLQMSADDFKDQNRKLPLPADSDLDDLIDDTADISGLFIEDMEDATIALNDDSLGLNKKLTH